MKAKCWIMALRASKCGSITEWVGKEGKVTARVGQDALCAAGVTLPKIGVFWLMDFLTSHECQGLEDNLSIASCPRSRAAAAGVNACTALGGDTPPPPHYTQPESVRTWNDTKIAASGD